MRPLLQNFLQGQLSSIEVSEALQPSNTLIDVRTSEEHFQGAIPGSRNHPLFDGLERSLMVNYIDRLEERRLLKEELPLLHPSWKNFSTL